MKLSFVCACSFLLLAVLASTGRAQMTTRGMIAKAAEAVVAAAAVGAGGGGGAAVPGPLPAGPLGGCAAVAGPVPAVNVVVVPAAPPAAAAAAAPAAAAAGGAGGAVPAGGPGGNVPVLGWLGWITGTARGVWNFGAAHPVAVGGAVVTVAAGVTFYHHGHHALDWALEGKDCYWTAFDDYQEVLQQTYGECTSLTQPLEWRKRAEALRACGTGTRPHQEQAEQARADRLAREVMGEMRQAQKREDARRAHERKEEEEREEAARQENEAREKAQRLEVHSEQERREDDDEVTNDLVHEPVNPQHEEQSGEMYADNDEDQTNQTEQLDGKQLEADKAPVDGSWKGQQEQQSGKEHKNKKKPSEEDEQREVSWGKWCVIEVLLCIACCVSVGFCVWLCAGSWWAITVGSLLLIWLVRLDLEVFLIFTFFPSGYLEEDARAKVGSDISTVLMFWWFLRVWMHIVYRFPNSCIVR